MKFVRNLMMNLLSKIFGAGQAADDVQRKLAMIYAFEGILFTLIITMAHNNNSLYAKRLGAGAFEIALMASLPPIIGMCLLIPFTMFMGRLRNKRSVVILSILALGAVYVLVGIAAFTGNYSVYIVIGLLVLANIPMSLYNTSWQAFFSDVVSTQDRNYVYGHRTRMNTAVGIFIPPLAGFILTVAVGPEKIVVHQIYYFLTFPIAMAQAYFLRKVPGGDIEQTRMTIVDLKEAAGSLVKNKVFLGYMLVALLVYCGWSMDWSLYFIAQFDYLELNETGLSLVAVLCAIAQFIALTLWNRLSVRKGVRFVFMIGAAGFAFCGISMVIALLLPKPFSVPFYFIFQSVGSSAFSAFQLSMFQCLLETLPQKGRTLSIAIYNTIIMSSNVIMPYLGSAIYRSLGETRDAMIIAMVAIAAVRIVATAAALYRWHHKRAEPLEVY